MACSAKQYFSALRRLVAGLALVGIAASAQAPGDIRIALVIGNSAYPGAAALANPANDAVAMTAALKTLGFSVLEIKDGSRVQMAQAIATVRDSLRGKQGVGMLYYAGHGLQLDWRNYMMPVDARPTTASEVAAQALDIETVITAFKTAGTRLNIVVLDACRDNPFAGSGSAKGLAQMNAPAGTFLAYSTAPGNVAEDGAGSNGLYTGYLVRELVKPAVRIEDVFKRVRLQVRQDSKGRQIPWESTSLEEDFYFRQNAQASSTARGPGAAASDARGLSARRGGADSQGATQGLELEKADWESVRDSRNPDDFYQFLKQHPSGMIAEQAQFRLDQLQRALVVAAPGPDGIAALPSGAWRYLKGDEISVDLIDGFTKERTRMVQRVTYADAERVEINGGRIVWDQMGGVLQNRFGRINLPVVLAPSDIYLGKKWRSAGTAVRPNGREDTVFWNFKVLAFEDIEVAAGKFKAFRVDRSGQSRHPNGSITFLTGTLWIDPKTMLVLRNDILYRSGGKITEYSSSELVAVRQVRRPPAGQ